MLLYYFNYICKQLDLKSKSDFLGAKLSGKMLHAFFPSKPFILQIALFQFGG